MEPYPLSGMKGQQSNDDGTLCCINDGAHFKGLIYSYPVEEKQGTWIVRGVFCSLGCAKQYLLDRRVRPEYITMLHSMALDVYQVDRIIAPGKPEILKRYCGDKGVSLRVYRDKSTRIELLDKQVMLPIQMQEETMYQVQLQEQRPEEDDLPPDEDQQGEEEVVGNKRKSRSKPVSSSSAKPVLMSKRRATSSSM